MDRTEKYVVIKKLRKEGMTQKKIAEIMGLCQSWVSRVLKMPEDRKPPKWGGHKPSKLSDEQKRELLSMLEQGAEAFGFEGNAWGGKRVKLLIEEKFGVSYHPDAVPDMLHKLGFSLQKPKSQDVRRAPKRVEASVKKELPELKKKPKKKTD